MTHSMNLNPEPFSLIKSGLKTIELRLNDEKRQLININDDIIFTNTENNQDTIQCKVVDLRRFSSFEELYKNLDLLKCGYTNDNIKTATHKDMDIYYSQEKQESCGVLGIELKLI